MRALCLALILLASAGIAKADCLHDIGQFHEQVDSRNRTRPTAQSQAAARELQKLERSESADEIDCYNTLAGRDRFWRHPLLRQTMITTPVSAISSDLLRRALAKK